MGVVIHILAARKLERSDLRALEKRPGTAEWEMVVYRRGRKTAGASRPGYSRLASVVAFHHNPGHEGVLVEGLVSCSSVVAVVEPAAVVAAAPEWVNFVVDRHQSPAMWGMEEDSLHKVVEEVLLPPLENWHFDWESSTMANRVAVPYSSVGDFAAVQTVSALMEPN